MNFGGEVLIEKTVDEKESSALEKYTMKEIEEETKKA